MFFKITTKLPTCRRNKPITLNIPKMLLFIRSCCMTNATYNQEAVNFTIFVTWNVCKFYIKYALGIANIHSLC